MKKTIENYKTMDVISFADFCRCMRQAMAENPNITEEELDAAPLDGVGFIPLMVKCLLDDPTQAKGNIIAISQAAL